MFAYWFLFLLCAMPALGERLQPPGAARPNPGLMALGLLIAFMIGLRFHVGADYDTYESMFRLVSRQDFDRIFEWGDPGYQLIGWTVGQLDGSMWHVNLICGAIFTWGLIRLCRLEPSPFLAALVAVPYLIIVVAMGYTRQAVALGFIMAGIAALSRGGSIIRFGAYVAAAALFHRTAIVVLPLAIFTAKRNHVLNFVAVLAMAYGLYTSLLADSVDTLVKGYVDARYNSQGALIRVAMNLIPAFVILRYSPRLHLNDVQQKLWKMFAIISLAMVPALFVVPSTTAIDRIALYLLPIQMVGLGRAILLFQQPAIGRVLVVGYCGTVLFVWLNFATHSHAWVPYRIALF